MKWLWDAFGSYIIAGGVGLILIAGAYWKGYSDADDEWKLRLKVADLQAAVLQAEINRTIAANLDSRKEVYDSNLRELQRRIKEFENAPLDDPDRVCLPDDVVDGLRDLQRSN